MTERGTTLPIVDILSLLLEKEIQATRAFYVKSARKASGPGIYSEYDWARINSVFSDVKHRGADSILDVGVGGGQLVNTLGACTRFARVAGLDIKRHSKFLRMNDRYEMFYASIGEMPFADDMFDTILCMEVLEHLDHDLFHAGLKELRRVCKKRLIMTVPFEEPEPLPHFNKQRFTLEDIRKLWPNGEVSLLKRPKFSWAMIVETW